MVIFDILDDEAYCRWLVGRELKEGLFRLDALESITLCDTKTVRRAGNFRPPAHLGSNGDQEGGASGPEAEPTEQAFQ